MLQQQTVIVRVGVMDTYTFHGLYGMQGLQSSVVTLS